MKRLMNLSRLSITLVIYMACAGYSSSAVAQRIDAGLTHTCALLPLASGGVSCWGSNSFGQLGNGETRRSLVPVRVTNLGGSATAVAVGTSHSCALLADGAVVRCWGQNQFGQLGDGSRTNRRQPVTVINLGGSTALPTAIAVGSNHTCALLSNGTVQCWGRNEFGQLGNDSTLDSRTPRTVQLNGIVMGVAAGGGHTCARLIGGTVMCWGKNSSGQLGNNSTSDSHTPLPVNDLSNVSAISTGTNYSCAFQIFGTVRCWGNNQFGQLGDGTRTNRREPVTVNLSNVAIAVSAGGLHTCAKLSNGTVQCWGRNQFGELGNGGREDSQTPVTVSDLPFLEQGTEVSAGFLHTCAFLLNGQVRCWGQNGLGQLGNATRNLFSSVPVTVSNVN